MARTQTESGWDDGAQESIRHYGKKYKKREQRKFHNKDIIFMTRPFLLKQSNEGG